MSTQFGTTGNDVLVGTSGDDQLFGIAGADTLLGGAGNDYIVGGAGKDQIDAGDGDDVAFSLATFMLDRASGRMAPSATGTPEEIASWESQVQGGAGNDILVGNARLDGGDGDDILIGGSILSSNAGAGSDILINSPGRGGPGRDTYIYTMPGNFVPSLSDAGPDLFIIDGSFEGQLVIAAGAGDTIEFRNVPGINSLADIESRSSRDSLSMTIHVSSTMSVRYAYSVFWGTSFADPNEVPPVYAVNQTDTDQIYASINARIAASAAGSLSTVSIAATSVIKAEGNDGTTAFAFAVTLDKASSIGQSVKWSVAGAGPDPAAASDFGGVLPSGTVTFAAGQTSQVVTVAVTGDSTVEHRESFMVKLSEPSAGLLLGSISARGTIMNDDAAAGASVVARLDAYTTLSGQAVHVDATTGVLLNDDGAWPLTASVVEGPAHGTLQMAADGGFDYVPATGFTGIDSFVYRAAGAGGSADAHAIVHVVPVSSGPSTTLDLLGLTAEEQIAATYVAFFGRGADAPGFAFWVGEFSRNLPTQGPAALFANIASSFGISAEAKALYSFLANPFGASNGQISAFLDSVYDNLFNRASDAGGLAYWSNQVQQTLAGGRFVGSVLVDIIGGAQNSAVGQDITTLMAKVATNIAYVREQERLGSTWTAADDGAEARALLDAVTADPKALLVGVAQAHDLVLADIL